MKLVAIVRPAPRLEEAVGCLAAAAGVTLAEARMRLAPEPPALVARLEDPVAGALVAALGRVGVAAVAIAAHPPSDADRVIARSASFSAAGATFTPRAGDRVELAWAEVVAVLRGQRAARSVVERTQDVKRLSVATAVATGGLSMTRTSRQTERSSTEAAEQVILVYARDGRAVVLPESQLDFSCLGTGMQPSSTANMGELARRLRDGARGAFHDDRLLRLGRRPAPFLAGGESRAQTATVTATRSDTSGALDALAEVLRQAVAQGLLP